MWYFLAYLSRYKINLKILFLICGVRWCAAFFVFVWFSVLWCGFHISELFMSNTFSTHTYCCRGRQDILKYTDMQTFPIHMWCVANVLCLRVHITRQAMMSYLDYEYYCCAYICLFSSLSPYDPYFIDEGVNHLETRKRNK